MDEETKHCPIGTTVKLKRRLRRASMAWAAGTVALFGANGVFVPRAFADRPPPPCHPNPHAAADRITVHGRGDVRNLPDRLQDRLERMAERPHTFLPMQAFAEADKPSQLFQYYLLDEGGFEANPLTALFPGVNDKAQLTVPGTFEADNVGARSSVIPGSGPSGVKNSAQIWR